MWIAAEHSDQDNLQWAWLRAIEWIGWPLFMSQPVVPVLLYFFEWPWILLVLFLATLLWRATVLQWFISVRLANLGALFVLLKFVTCPIMAVLIWRQGDYISAVLALLWPLAGLELIGLLLSIIHGVLGTFVPCLSAERTMYIGPVQRRFMAALGYTRRTPSPDEVFDEERRKAKEYPFGKESPNLFMRDGKDPSAQMPEKLPEDLESRMAKWREWQRKEPAEIQRVTQDIIRRAQQEAAQEMRDLIEPLEAEFAAHMKELSTKTKLGYEKATAAYLAGEGDSNYKRHMKHWYGQMKAILGDKSNPQAAAELRATLQQEYKSVTMPEWDKRQIAKLIL